MDSGLIPLTILPQKTPDRVGFSPFSEKAQ